MKDLTNLKDTFLKAGMKPSNIDYAIDAVNYGTEKELIAQILHLFIVTKPKKTHTN